MRAAICWEVPLAVPITQRYLGTWQHIWGLWRGEWFFAFCVLWKTDAVPEAVRKSCACRNLGTV